jgi:hypothetical protein
LFSCLSRLSWFLLVRLNDRFTLSDETEHELALISVSFNLSRVGIALSGRTKSRKLAACRYGFGYKVRRAESSSGAAV